MALEDKGGSMRERSALAIRCGTVLACLLMFPFLTWVRMAILWLVTSVVPNPEGVLNTLVLGLYAPVFFASLVLTLTVGYLFFAGRRSPKSLVSPDGRRIAFTARDVYGPEDLLVVFAN